MGEGKISVLFVSFIFIISCILTSKMAKADEPIVTKTISGIISYNIGENGENNAKKVTKVLGNYPVILVYKDVNNKTKSIQVITNSSGYYTTVINSSVKISAVWFEILSENKSCSVYRKFKLINNKPYSYKSNEFPINVKQNTININLKIEDDNVIGALNIARVINNAKDFFFNATGIDTPKIPVYWTYGVGENSFTLTDPAFEPVGNFGFMQLSGEDHDERDESVIVHEYGHWVFGKIRGIGRFMSGSHSSSKEIHSALAYSEGLATFFGQSFLNIDQYVDGGTLKYSIETPPSRFTKGINNEAYVSASLWDVIDSYNNTEQWDNVTDYVGDVFSSNIDVIMNADIVPGDYTDMINTALMYFCNLYNFYDTYTKDHVVENSNEAYNFWRIFEENGMSFDIQKPQFSVIGEYNSGIVVDENNPSITLKLYDNVKVSKIEFYISGKKIGFVINPGNEYTYHIPKALLEYNVNVLKIKVYDYQGNYVSDYSVLSKPYPAKDFFSAYNGVNGSTNYNQVSYREPYAAKTIAIIKENSSALSSFSINSHEEKDIQNTTSETIEKLATTYGLTSKEVVVGHLDQNELSELHTFTVERGQDYAVLIEDNLGEFEITLTDPNGNVFTNIVTSEQINNNDDISKQVILSMGGTGLMMFQPIPGNWTYSIHNNSIGSEFVVGIYNKISAPILYNEEELLHIQDGHSVELRGVINSLLETEETALEASLNIHLTGVNSGIAIQDVINVSGEYTYSFSDLPNDYYTLELYSIGADGRKSWVKDANIIVNSLEPEILLDDDYEYYIYPGKAIIEGVGVNADNIKIYVNEQRVYVTQADNSNGIAFTTDYLELLDGENYLQIISETETGKTITKQLILNSISEEECFIDEHQPYIESVLFNDNSSTVINGQSQIKVRLTNNNTEDYKVYAICNNMQYNFSVNGEYFILDFIPEYLLSGNYKFNIYAVSKWQMYDYREMDITIIEEDGGLYLLQQPEDFYVDVNETASINLNEIFSGDLYNVQATVGIVEDGIWSFTPDQEGIYDVTIKAFNEKTEVLVNYYVITKPEVGFHLQFNPNGGTVNELDRYVSYGQAYGKLPVPTQSGYSFIGWFSEPEGGYQIFAETIVDDVASNTIYAHWKGLNYTITFYANGGTVSPISKSVTFGSGYGVLPVPVRANYIFEGWFTKLSGGVLVSDKSIVNILGSHILYAIWTKISYEITFDANGGIVTPSSILVYPSGVYGTMPTPIRDNYIFNGWYTQAYGGTLILSSTKVNITESQTLYAHWTGNSYTVTLDANGGNIAGNNITNFTVKYGEQYGSVLLSIPTKENSKFLGWFTQLTGGMEITHSSIVNITQSQTLYAQWKDESYTVHFNATGGSVLPSSKVVVNGDTYGSLPIPVKDNYVFLGWFTEAFGGTEIKEDTPVNLFEIQTLYAHWVDKVYKITFDANGGSIQHTSINVIQGTTYGTLPIPLRVNYTFGGWYTQASGGTLILESSKVTLVSDQTLYAHWNGNSYRVILDACGGTIAGNLSVNIDVIHGCNYGIGLTTVPTKYGYEFLGWYTQAFGGTRITSENTVDITEQLVLYAHWGEKSYTVTFDANGGKVLTSTLNVTNGAIYGELPIPTKENYIFQGWYTQLSGGIEITKDSIVSLAMAQTVFAQWVGTSYEVTFDAVGGELTQSSISVCHGSSYGLLPVPSKVNYTFKGWFTQEIGGLQLSDNSIVLITSNQTLYAHWEGIRYKVTLDANGGSINGMDSIEFNVIFGETYGSTLMSTPIKTGYKFVGWYEQVNEGDKLLPTSTVTTMNDQRLFAHWEVISHTIIFNSNGGTVFIPNKDVINGETYGTLPIPIRSGYTFSGWYTQINGGLQISEDSIAFVLGTQTLYAHWIGSNYIVTFNSNGGTVSLNNKNVTLGSSYGALPVPIRDNRTFTGWYTQATGGEIVVESSIVSIPDNHMLYAHWADIVYHVILDANGGLFNYEEAYVSTKWIYVAKGKSYGFYNGIPTPVREGFEFVGWYTDKFEGNVVKVTDIVTNESEHTLYAHWKRDVTVLFDANGGVVSTGHMILTYGSKYSILPIPTREYYVFTGWFDQSSNYGMLITENSIVTKPETHILYAHWVGEKYSVTFNANGGSVSQNEKDIYYGDVYGAMPFPTRVGYTFTGWFTDINSGTVVADDTVINTSGNRILYAHWSPNIYRVTLISEGIQTGSINVYYNSIYGGELPVPTRSGYDFIGWYSEYNGGFQYTSANITRIISDISIYAHWKGKNYNVSFNANGGSTSVNYKQVTYNSNYGALTIPVRADYDFIGWFTDPYGGSQITEDSIVGITGDHTLYAHWLGKAFTVILDPNGGDLTQTNISVILGNTYGSLPAPTKANYTFQGWFTSTGIKVNENTVVTISGIHTLYARWMGVALEVKFDANGGTVSPDSMLVYYESKYGTLPTPVKAGQDFIGWYTANGIEITSTSTVNVLSNQVLYARWTTRTLTLIFITDADVEPIDNKIVVCGEAYGTLPKPVKDGYKFLGWCIATPEHTYEFVNEGTIATTPEILYLFDLWEEN